MKYFINDLWKGTRWEFESSLELVLFWNQKIALGKDDPFAQLNVTGKDTYPDYEYIPGQAEANLAGLMEWVVYPSYKKVIRLHRYHVSDSDGRSIDIRNWTEDFSKAAKLTYNPFCKPWHKKGRYSPPPPKFRKEPCGWGRKLNSRRMGMPAMMKDSFVYGCIGEEHDELEYLPVVDGSKFRKRGIDHHNAWEMAEDKYWGHHRAPKSWKDQTKAGRQWAKHKTGCSAKVMRQNPCQDGTILDELFQDTSTVAPALFFG